MCGIAGIMTVDGGPADASVLQRLADALSHRGPDGGGRHIRGGLALVHTRLAIIDLITGDQPIFASPGGGRQAAIIANAEIYNYVELRRDMEGAAFSTRSDCEPPLHLYLRHGLDFTRHLRGMYAIAIDDPLTDSLVLARDPFGIKPLYYAETAAAFAFASEAQALHKCGLVTPSLRPEARDQLLQLKFTCGGETAFEGIHRVLPGETIVVRRGRIVERRHLAALPGGGPVSLSEGEAEERVEAALRESVAVHQRSDVPYGMFLSGGVDSSVVLSFMRDLNDTPVEAFTVGFSGTSVHDERDHARAVAEAAGARFEAVEFSPDDFWGLLPAICAAMDDPVADYAVLPTYKLARLAQERCLKVILTGEGGDEIFGGYSRYRRLRRPWFLGGRQIRRSGVFDGLGVLRRSAAGMPANSTWRAGIARAEAEQAGTGRTPVQAAQAVDCADWLPHDLLFKLDRCLMAFGVEGRVPFLDPRVAEAAFLLPDKMKVRSGMGKWILRRLLERKLPQAKPFSRKRGFTVPTGQWILERGKEVGPLVARQPGVEEACLPGAVERLFATAGKKQGQAAWNLLFFALWHRAHILGLPPAGDVFETLAA